MTATLPASPPVPSSSIARSTTTPRAVRSLLASVLVVVLTVLAITVGVHAAAAAPAQDPAPTEAPAVTGEDGTVSGDDLDPGAVTVVEPVPDTADRSAVDAENRRIWLVVGGLVAVAVAIGALTVRYWFQTRPVPVTEPLAGAATGGRRVRGRRSRRAVAGADHATADESWEPRGTGEHDRVHIAPVARQTRPTADQRRAAYEAARRT